jgi:YD repeat-containing protein
LDDERKGGGGLVGETVRIVNGNVILQREDIRIPSPHRLGLCLLSTYNSRSTFAGAMGYGWTHNYNVFMSSVHADSNRSVLKLMDSTGRMRYFSRNTDGQFQGMYHEPSRITQSTDGYIWHKNDGMRFGLSPDGRLKWIEDFHGNRLTMDYNPQGLLATVNDLSSGRALAFEYQENGMLTAVYGPVIDSIPDGRWVSFAYDASGNLSRVSYADGSGYGYTHEDLLDPHNITQKQDILSHELGTWAYDEMDRVLQRTDRKGQKDSFAYESVTRVTAADAYGEKRFYTLTTIGPRKMLAALQGASLKLAGDNPAVRWQYDSQMNLVEVQYASGLIHRFADHDLRGNPAVEIVAPDSLHERVIRYTYHPQLNLPLSRREDSLLGAGEKVTLWDFDADDNLIPNEMPSMQLGRIIERGFTSDVTGNRVPYEHTWSFEYHPNGQLLAVDGPRSGSEDETRFYYDPPSGNLLRIFRPLIGAFVFSEYDAAGRAHLMTGVNGQAKRLSYDARGRITAAGQITDNRSAVISYTAAGLMETIADEDRVAYGFSYEEIYGRLASISDTQGSRIAFEYDRQGNLVEKSIYSNAGALVGQKRWSYQHPTFPGRLWKEILSDGSYTEYDYNEAGQLIAMIDPNGHETTYSYDSLGRLTAVAQPLDAVTYYSYNLYGYLKAVTDAEGLTTSYLYDDLGRVVKRTSPDSGETRYAYDAAGNLIAKTDANHVTVVYYYDSLNRLTAIRFPNPVDDITFSYDEGPYGKGRQTGMSDASGSTRYAYNPEGELIEKTVAFYGQDYVLRASHTAAGRLATLLYASGRKVEYLRDSNGRIKEVRSRFKGETVSLASDLAYHPFGGGLSDMQSGAGGSLNNQAGACGCLTIANIGEDMEQQYHYDSNGNLTALETTRYPELSVVFVQKMLCWLSYRSGAPGPILRV